MSGKSSGSSAADSYRLSFAAPCFFIFVRRSAEERKEREKKGEPRKRRYLRGGRRLSPMKRLLQR